MMTLRLSAFIAIFSLLLGAAPARPAELPGAGLLLRLSAADAASLRLEEGKVARWQSTVPGHACALTAQGSHRPEFRAGGKSAGRAVVSFDGRDDLLEALDFNQKAEVWTLILVAAPGSPARGGGLCSATPAGGNDYDPGFTVDLYESSTEFNSLNVEGAGRIGLQKNLLTTNRPLDEPYLVVVERDRQEVRVFIDGRPEGKRPATPALTVMEQLRLGARRYDGAERQYFMGDIAEVALYNRILPAQERQAVEASLGVSPQEREAERKGRQERKEERRRNRMIAPRVVERWPGVEEFLRARQMSQAELEQMPIRTDIRQAIVLGAQSLDNHFNLDRNRPAPLNDPRNTLTTTTLSKDTYPEQYWGSGILADGTGEMAPHERAHALDMGVSHAVGRNVWASLLVEETLGRPVPAESMRILTQYMHDLYDNIDHLSAFYDPQKHFERFAIAHDQREGFLGLFALQRVRHDPWAAETLKGVLDTLERLTDEQGHLSNERVKAVLKDERVLGFGNDATTSGRLIEPLVEYYLLTSDRRALELAGRFTRATLASTFTPEGKFTPWTASSGHIHSITSSFCGIVRYALVAGDKAMLAQCKVIIDQGVPEYASSWGWVDEVMPDHPADEISRGESNQTGDLIRAALLLGQSVSSRYYEMAECYLRNTLLPTQHREDELVKYLKDVKNPKGDWQRDVIRRVTGGYSMQLPNDRMQEGAWPLTTQDIISGALHALCECWKDRAQVEGTACRVNLLFDSENEAFIIKSDLPRMGRIRFEARRGTKLSIRVPAWVARETLKVTVGGKSRPVRIVDDYAVIESLAPQDKGELSFAVPCRVEKETVDGVQYTTTWVGNQVIEILPRGTVSPLPF